MNNIKPKKVAFIVTNPDDETILASGTILSHPSWKCFIISIYRRSDEERATKFQKELEALKAEGIMCDFDEGFEQLVLNKKEVKRTILELLPEQHYDLIISRNPNGGYIHYLRQKEISKAIMNLWISGKLLTDELRTFAYARWS